MAHTLLQLETLRMKRLQKNYLLLNRNFKNSVKKNILCLLFLTNSIFALNGQISNYILNGGFEKVVEGSSPPVAMYWGATDSLKLFGELMTANLPPFNVPLSSYTYQWPKHGNNYLATTNFCPTCGSNIRGYPRNRLKQELELGRTYCFSMYLNLTNKSSYAIDGFGIYFSDSITDTIKYCNRPLTYLTPQIQNPIGTFLSDTLNWIFFSGLYTATGKEKYVLIGNYMDNAATGTLLVNSATLPQVFASYLYDDVSLIDINLPAFAGRDTIVFPGSSVFIGREPDVGIDEACIWYKLPDLVNPIDTIAGFWINPTTTATYIVKQQLWCNNTPKWDTVVVEISIYVGLESKIITPNNLLIFPTPAQDFIELRVSQAELFKEIKSVAIYDNLGQLLGEQKINFENKSVRISTSDLPNGIYFIRLKSNDSNYVNKRFVVSR
jgi:hypothetical protein